MSTAQAASNRATCRRFHDLWNTGDAELISETKGVAEHRRSQPRRWGAWAPKIRLPFRLDR
jgi:hypothetical protein